jgi:hypothetical protein
MEAPGLTDIYTFGDWLKKFYQGPHRKPLCIKPIQGGLIEVTEVKEVDDGRSETSVSK